MESAEQFKLITTSYAGEWVQQPVSPYVYSPLSERDNEIRLVRLKSSREPVSRIEGSLEHHSLLDAPPYVALSYEVGNPAFYAVILLDGVQVPVSVNLFTALHHLRHHGYLLLWVDSLCINQTADEEKNSQILRIQVIYQDAEQVAVWLGPEAHGSWKVMRHVRSTRKGQQILERGSSAAVDKYDRRLLPELSCFFDRSYWSRAWIIQEVVAGSRVILFCGWEYAEWDDLEILVCRIFPNATFHDLHAEPVKYLIEARKNKREGFSMSMLEVLHRTSFSRTTNPMDKVYSILRLAFDYSAYVSEPKYGWGSAELCMRMSKTFISSKRSLDIIFLGRKSRRSTMRLPSWCPDYTTFPSWSHLSHLVNYVSGQDERVRLGTVGRKWKTTEATVLTKQVYMIQQGLLRVKGARAASIKSLANLIGEDEIKSSSGSQEKPKDWLSRLASLFPPSPSQSDKDDIGRILFLLYNKDYKRHYQNPSLFNHLLYGFDSSDYREEKLETTPELEAIKQWRRINKRFLMRDWELDEICSGKKPQPVEPDYRQFIRRSQLQNAGQTFGPLTTTPLTTQPMSQSPVVMAFRQGAQAAQAQKAATPSIDIYTTLTALADLITEGLRLMTTNEGHFGWAHPVARPGDGIYLLAGCSMPVILQSHKSHPGAFTVIGHAYVDKMMEGDFWKGCVERGLDDIDIL